MGKTIISEPNAICECYYLIMFDSMFVIVSLPQHQCSHSSEILELRDYQEVY